MTARETPQQSTTRRRLLTLLGAGGAAVAVTQLPITEAAGADGDPLILGSLSNAASSPTGLNSNASGAAFAVNNTSPGGSGLSVQAAGGVTVAGATQDGIAGSFVANGTGQAIVATGGSHFSASEGFAVSIDNDGGGGIQLHTGGDDSTPSMKVNRETNGPVEDAATIFAVSSLPGGFGDGPNTGVLGGSGTGQGIHGHSASGVGVGSSTDTGVGVQGYSASGVAGWFLNEEGQGVALRVSGVAEFDNVGSWSIPRGRNNVLVQNQAVTENSHISVTLASDPGPRSIQWVQRIPGTGFRVHLTAAPESRRPLTELSYLIVEPSSG